MYQTIPPELLHPEMFIPAATLLDGNTITIGASGIRLTAISAQQNQNLSTLEQDILGQTEKIENISCSAAFTTSASTGTSAANPSFFRLPIARIATSASASGN